MGEADYPPESFLPAKNAQYDKDHEYDNSDQEQQLGDAGSCARDAAKTQHAGDDGDHREDKSPLQHCRSP
jgi:hypothetical protein